MTSQEWRVARVHNIGLNDTVDTYEGSLELAVTNGERVRDIRVRFRRESEGGIKRDREPIWRWENPSELEEITLAESVGWDLTDETDGWDVHGYVRGGEWESV